MTRARVCAYWSENEGCTNVETRVLLRIFYLYSISLSYSLLLQRERLTGARVIFTEPTKTRGPGVCLKG